MSLKVIRRLGIKHDCRPKLVSMLDGKTTSCEGEVDISIQTEHMSVNLRCLVASTLVGGFSVILGMDAVKGFGGLTVDSTCTPCLGSIGSGVQLTMVAAAGLTWSNALCVEVDDCDFTALFDGSRWTVVWKWKVSEPVLKNQCGEYKVRDECRAGYEKEVEAWIESGWLVEHNELSHGKVGGGIPMMALLQQNKDGKIRPVNSDGLW